jgi:hypothetical protein
LIEAAEDHHVESRDLQFDHVESHHDRESVQSDLRFLAISHAMLVSGHLADHVLLPGVPHRADQERSSGG